MDATPRRGIPLPDGIDDFDEDPSEITAVLPRRVIESHDWSAESPTEPESVAGRRAAAAPEDEPETPPVASRPARDKQPVLPPTSAAVSAAASTGRRFSASDEVAPRRSATSPSQWASPADAVPRRSATSPSAWSRAPEPRRSATSPSQWAARPLPRRSATSPSLWDSPPESEVKTVLRPRGAEPIIPPPAHPRPGAPTPAGAPEATPFAATQAAEPDSPSAQAAAVVTPQRRTWPWLVLALLLTAAVVAAWSILKPETQTDNPGTQEVPAALQLVSPEQLSDLPGTWQTTQDVATLDDHSPAAKCLTGSTQRLPRAQASSLRLLGTTDGATLLHRLDTYTDRGTAIDAFAARRAQLSTCDSPVHIVGASQPLGLGDDALVLEVVAQEAAPVTHTVLLMRVGSGIEVLDLGAKGNVASPKELSAVAGKLVADHCERLEGTCSATNPRVTPIPPPTGGDAGFLLPADLPRLSPGVGTWVATAPTPKIDLTGSGCEVTKPAEAAANKRFQRTLILTNDPTAGKAFGIDTVVFQLASPGEATALAGKFNEAISTCASRVANASVERITQSNGTADNGNVTATTAHVTQRPAGNAVVFRTGVVVVGNRVVYLVETPKETYGLSDAQWGAAVIRAGQRAAQMP